MWTLLILIGSAASLHTVSTPPNYNTNGTVTYTENSATHTCTGVTNVNWIATSRVAVVVAENCK